MIIPTWRPDERFRKLICGLQSQTIRPDRILIMNTEEQFFDSTLVENVDDLCIRHIRKEDFDHGATRDMAARMAATDIILFMTMDAIPADGFMIERLLEPFHDSRVCASYARQLPAQDCKPLERCTRMFNYGEESMIKTKSDLPRLGIKTFFCSNACAAYRRSMYLELGGFVKHTIFNEDMIFAGNLIRADRAIAYCAEAKVIHSHNYSGIQQLKRNFDLGVSQADHPEIFSMARSESEGSRLVRRTAKALIDMGKPHYLPQLVWQSGCKLIGYRMGKNYQRLPEWMIMALTMNPTYWKKCSSQN